MVQNATLKTTKIAIVGTRDMPKRLLYKLFVPLGVWLQTEQRMYSRLPPPVMVVTGGGGNVDLGIEWMAREYKIPYCVFPADWHGPDKKGAGPIRNQWIADECHAAIALHNGSSTGTLDTINRAKFANKLTRILYPLNYAQTNTALADLKDSIEGILEWVAKEKQNNQ